MNELPATAETKRSAYQEAVQASTSISNLERLAEFSRLAVDNKPLPLSRAKSFRDANQDQLSALRSALRRGLWAPTHKMNDSPSEEYSALRQGARLLVLDGRVHAAQGNYRDAVGAYLDAVELGVQLPQGSPSLFSGLVSMAIKAIGMLPMWQVVPHLSAEDSRAAIARLQTLERRSLSPSQIILGEQKVVLEGSEDFYRDLKYETDVPVDKLPSLKQFTVEYSAYSDFVAHQVDAPLGLRRKPTLRVSPLTEILVQLLRSSMWGFDRTRTQWDELLVSLALQAHKQQTGTYPESLEKISRDTLPYIPVDAFGYGESLRYRKDGEKYVLWSVGPDRKDDGGRPMENPQYKGRRRYVGLPASKGDFVAGLNY